MALTLVQITDTHIHDQLNESFINTQPDESLDHLIKHALKNLDHIDYVVVTGDLTHEGTKPACTRLGRLLNQFDCPVFVTLGNHDSSDMIQQHLLTTHITMPEHIETEYWQLLFADSHIENQTAGLLSDRTIEQLSAQLQHNDKPAFMFTHHPPVSINSRWMDEIGMHNGELVLQKLSDYKHLRGLAFGHIHQQWRSQYQHIEILGSPSSCVQFKTGSDDFAIDDHSPGYRVLSLHDNGTFSSEVIRMKAHS